MNEGPNPLRSLLARKKPEYGTVALTRVEFIGDYLLRFE